MSYDIIINVSKQNICNAEKISTNISLVKCAKINPVNIINGGGGGQVLQYVIYY